MGKIFQIKGALNQNFAYPMNQMGDEFINANLSYANNYQVYPGYYPNSSAIDVNYYNKAVNLNELQCKEQCNNSTNCGYYFAYTKRNNKCIIDTRDSVPVSNRVPPKNTNEPVDEGFNLYICNYQFDHTTTTMSFFLKKKSKYSLLLHQIIQILKYSIII